MIRFIDRLLYRLQRENKSFNSRGELVSYLECNNSWFEELKQIAKEKTELAITRVFDIIQFNL